MNQSLRKCMFGLAAKKSENADAAGADLTGLENFASHSPWVFVEA